MEVGNQKVITQVEGIDVRYMRFLFLSVPFVRSFCGSYRGESRRFAETVAVPR